MFFLSVADAYALYKGKRRPSSALVLDSTDFDYGMSLIIDSITAFLPIHIHQNHNIKDVVIL